jgi:hypothetical protein
MGTLLEYASLDERADTRVYDLLKTSFSSLIYTCWIVRGDFNCGKI